MLNTVGKGHFNCQILKICQAFYDCIQHSLATDPSEKTSKDLSFNSRDQQYRAWDLLSPYVLALN